MVATEINAAPMNIPTRDTTSAAPRSASPKHLPTFLPPEVFIVGALEQQARANAWCADEARNRAKAARIALKSEHDPVRREEIEADLADARADTGFFQRASTAYTNALREWQRGVRPDQLPGGAWFLPSSSSSGGEGHILTMDGTWGCSCRAAGQMHWPIALLLAIELAEDMAGLDAPAPEQDDEDDEWVLELGGVPLSSYEADCENNDGVWL